MKPAVGDPASAGGMDQKIHRGPFQTRTFCDSYAKETVWHGFGD